MSNFNVGGSILSGGVECFVISVLQSLGKTVQEKGVEYAQSKMFGLGVNDEVLFFSAVTYAVENLKLNKDDLMRIYKNINEFPEAKQARIVLIIGNREEDLTRRTILPGTDKKKGRVKEVVHKANIGGAKLLAHLGSLTDGEMKLALERMAATRNYLKNFLKVLDKSVEGFKADCEGFFAKETKAQRKVRLLRESGQI